MDPTIAAAIANMDVLHSGLLWPLASSSNTTRFRAPDRLLNYILRNYGTLQCTDINNAGVKKAFRIRDSHILADEVSMTFQITPRESPTFSLGARDAVEFQQWADALMMAKEGDGGTTFVVDRTDRLPGGSCVVFGAKREKDEQAVLVRAVSRKGRVGVVALVETTIGKLLMAVSDTRYPTELVRVLEVYHTKNEAQVVMERVWGTSLETYLEQNGVMTDKDAREVFLQVFKAVEFLHGINILHGAVTTSNVLFTGRNLKLKLTGFNCASWNEEQSDCFFPPRRLAEYQGLLKRDGHEYIAPELWKGVSANRPADFWGLGCILYKMLLGRLPWAVTKQWGVSLPEEERITLKEYGAETRPDFMQAVLFPPNCDKVKGLTPDAKSMLFQLLRPNPKYRMSHINIKRHPWMTLSRPPPDTGGGHELTPADYFD